ncbi:MAG: hypothetical protein WC551_08965 [Patescibacteria group bacterium]
MTQLSPEQVDTLVTLVKDQGAMLDLWSAFVRGEARKLNLDGTPVKAITDFVAAFPEAAEFNLRDFGPEVQAPVTVCGRSPVSTPISGVKPDVCKACTKTREEQIYDYMRNCTLPAGMLRQFSIDTLSRECGLSVSAVRYAVAHSNRIHRSVDDQYTGRRPAALYWAE